MRNAKLWSVLLAALLLCACIAGVLFTGASASDSRIPTATTTYVVGTDGATIRECLEKAAAQTWAENTVLEIQFSGEDTSAFAKPNAAEGISGHILFEVPTIFREDDTQLPIVIRGMDEEKAALIKTAQNLYNATNDYFFTNLTMNGGDGVPVEFYAGSGELVFENCKFNNYVKTSYYGDCRATDAYEGWDAAKIAANSNDKDLVETGIVFGNGCTGLFATGGSGQHYAAVGFDGSATTNPVIFALKRAKANATKALTEDEVKAAQEAAPLATFVQGNVVTIEDCPVKPWDTAAYLIIDLGTQPTKEDTTPDIGMAGARKGVSPVRDAKLELISGGCQYISVEADSANNETFVGDTSVIMRGGRSGRQSGTSSQYSDVGIRVTNLAMFVGDLTLEIHEDDPNYPTWTPWIQTSQSAETSTVFGNFHFLMTGGTIGDGTHGNDGYWGAPVATGTIVNEVRGGKLWAFYGSRYANSRENTPVSTVLPGTGETLAKNVTVHNKISGGTFGELVDGKVSSTKGFHGQVKGAYKLASVCNEITGGTFYWFNAASSGTGTACGNIYNFISGTEENAPRFLSHFYGTRCTVTTPSVTNVFKGTPVFQNLNDQKLSIFGGCANGTVTKIDNYLGGMPVFDDFYGVISGSSAGKGIAGDITNTIALDMTEKAISNYVWGGNGYYQINGVDGATESKGHGDSAVTGSITCNIYSGHFGTFRAESAVGKLDVCPMTVNVHGGKWSSDYMPANRNYARGKNPDGTAGIVTNNIYGGEFYRVYMGGQNANDREFVNNVYGGTFASQYFGGGGTWVKKVTNNIYGGTFEESFYGAGGGYTTSTKTYYGTGFESVVNNIYGGTFSDSHEYMGAYSNPSTETNICETSTIENNLYGGDLGKNWLYCGNRNGTVGTIENNFYSGEKNPIRTNSELSKYLDAEGNTTKASGTYFRDQVICGLGYSEANINTNRVGSITNTFDGASFTKAAGALTDITIRCGMRWGIVGDITNNFISGSYYRVFGGCDFGYVTGKITNTYGAELEEGEVAPALSFSNYVCGGGFDQTPDRGKSGGVQLPAILFSERIEAARAAEEPTSTEQAWIAIGDEFGDDFAGGAKTIENNIYYGTFHQFYGGSYGSTSTATAAVSHIDTITNNVYGGVFEKLGSDNYAFIGGCFRNAVIDTITNNIKGGLYNTNYYGGSIGIGTVDCKAIVNVIDYAEGNETTNMQFYFGNGGPTFNGTVTSTVNGFKANRGYIYAGSNSAHNQPEGVEYGVVTTINGGEFSGYWGVGGGTSSVYTGNVKTVVNGGTFNGYAANMPNAFAGGTRNGTVIGNTVNEIYGGTFTANVVGGTILGSTTSSNKKVVGDITTTIYGGDFQRNLYALSGDADLIDFTGTAAINVEQTAGVELAFNGKGTFTNFKAKAEEVKIGANTNLKIENVEGRLILNQTEGWLTHDYLILPATADFAIIESPEIFGMQVREDGETIRIYGGNIAPLGATIRLAERVGVRMLLDKDEVDVYGDAFTFAVNMGETTLISGGKEDLVDYKGYYSILFDGIGLSNFDDEFVLSGSCFEDEAYSIEGLAAIAANEWAVSYPKWAAYAEALSEFNGVYNHGNENNLVPEAVEKEPVPAKGEAGVENAEVALLMSDAAGIRLTATVNGTVENAKIKIGENEVEATVTTETIPAVEEGGEDTVVTTITADVYFAHEYLAEEFVVSVESDAGVHMTYTASIEQIAAKLANTDSNEQKNNATAFLVYIQKAVACK